MYAATQTYLNYISHSLIPTRPGSSASLSTCTLSLPIMPSEKVICYDPSQQELGVFPLELFEKVAQGKSPVSPPYQDHY